MTILIDIFASFSFKFLFKRVPLHTDPCSEFPHYVYPLRRFSKAARLQFKPKPESSGFEVEANLEANSKVKRSTLNAPMSTNKVSIFKLTIKD